MVTVRLGEGLLDTPNQDFLRVGIGLSAGVSGFVVRAFGRETISCDRGCAGVGLSGAPLTLDMKFANDLLLPELSTFDRTSLPWFRWSSASIARIRSSASFSEAVVGKGDLKVSRGANDVSVAVLDIEFLKSLREDA